MIAYLETSAAAKLIKQEVETAALKVYLDSLPPTDRLVTSVLTHTELHRIVERDPRNLSHLTANAVLSRMSIIFAEDQMFHFAGTMTGENLRSLDALHIAAAMQIGADVMIAYDIRQQNAATAVGIRIIEPR